MYFNANVWVFFQICISVEEIDLESDEEEISDEDDEESGPAHRVRGM